MFSTSKVRIAVVNTNPSAYLMLKDNSNAPAVLCLYTFVMRYSNLERSSLLNRIIDTIEVTTIISAYFFKEAPA